MAPKNRLIVKNIVKYREIRQLVSFFLQITSILDKKGVDHQKCPFLTGLFSYDLQFRAIYLVNTFDNTILKAVLSRVKTRSLLIIKDI